MNSASGNWRCNSSHMAVGHAAHAHETDFAFTKPALANLFPDRRQRRRTVPAHVLDDRLRLGAGLVIEEMDEDRRIPLRGKSSQQGDCAR